jgi:transcriptional regulator with XRE-family HTH domain
MRSAVGTIMALRVRRSLAKFGADLSLARRQRHLSIEMMCERVGVSKATWQKMEKGDASVSLGAYAQALFALGFGAPFAELIDQRSDERGLLLGRERVPKRVVTGRRRVERTDPGHENDERKEQEATR